MLTHTSLEQTQEQLVSSLKNINDDDDNFYIICAKSKHPVMSLVIKLVIIGSQHCSQAAIAQNTGAVTPCVHMIITTNGGL